MKYGLPYKGSKNKLAERIVRLLPKRTHLVDLFCGGCAVSHAALLMGKYEHIHINDINWMCPTLFIDALNGKYNNENRWISREDFFRLKDTDPYVAFVWSFGNNLRDYLYSREIEPLKKAIHYAIFFSDYSLGKELRYDLSFIDSIQDLQKRFLAVQHYFGKLGHFQHQSFEGGRISDFSLWKQCHVSLPICRIGWGRKDLPRLDTMERQTPLRIATLGRYQPNATIQKKNYKRPSELEHNERRNIVASIATPRKPAPSVPYFLGGICQ
uniref:DNA adenine methylase n=1 Tax=Alloprevotella sp. TaxID=1872471 RepID=UPI004029ABB7